MRRLFSTGDRVAGRARAGGDARDARRGRLDLGVPDPGRGGRGGAHQGVRRADPAGPPDPGRPLPADRPGLDGGGRPATSPRWARRSSSGWRPSPWPASWRSTGDTRRWGSCVGAVLSGWALSFALKAAFDRPRPDLVPHLMRAYFSSFPSGHSMMSAVVYGTLGSLLSSLVTRRRLKFYFLAWRPWRRPGGGQPGLPRGPLPDRRPGRLVGRARRGRRSAGCSAGG